MCAGSLGTHEEHQCLPSALLRQQPAAISRAHVPPECCLNLMCTLFAPSRVGLAVAVWSDVSLDNTCGNAIRNIYGRNPNEF